MKKKMLFLAALVAATTAFTGCSKDEDLAQVPEVAPAMGDPEPFTFPMFVSATTGGETRGTDLTSSSFAAFTMYSNMTGSASWNTGVAFTKGTSWGAGSVDTSFPDNTNTYTFYGVSDAANITKTSGNPNISEVTAESFSFTYQIPTTYADQQDLLVGKTTGTGADGEVNFTGDNKFTHALAKIKAIKVYCNIDKVDNAGDKVNYRFRINGIRLGGLNTVGTYTFGSGWGSLSGNDVFEVPLTASGLTFGAMEFQPGAKATAVTLPLTDDGLYLIPQVAAGAVASVGTSYEITGAYAELDAQVFFYSDYETSPELGGAYRVGENLWSGFEWDEESSDAVGFGKIRVPLSFTITPNNGYTLVLDISRAVIYENEGSDAGTAVSEPIFSGATIVVG